MKVMQTFQKTLHNQALTTPTTHTPEISTQNKEMSQSDPGMHRFFRAV